MATRAFFIALMLLVSIVGCAVAPTAGTGPAYRPTDPQPNTAAIVHYRKLESFGRGNTYVLMHAGRPVVGIGNGGYFTHTVPIGKIDYLSKVHRDTSGIGIFRLGNVLENQYREFEPVYSLQTVERRTYFIRWSVAPSGFARVEEVSPETAAMELRDLKAWLQQ